MTPERYRQIGELYHAALELKPNERAAFLDQSCAGDDSLRHEVERLLASNEEAGSFLAAPADLIAEDQADALIGRILGRYRILSRIGAGGMGEVYLAEDERLGRKVALKLLPAEFAAHPDRLRRFEREAKAASATDHPNIVTIHEIGETDGIHFIAEEYVEGETLRRQIERGPVPLLDALHIAQQVAGALAAAHAAGIVHRDIKPENVMLRPDGYVKVLDFGLAFTEQLPTLASNQKNAGGHDSSAQTIPAVTTPGTILGTVSYMSPEQTRGQRADARSDLWSLGVVLYEMLTQRQPFRGDSVPDIFVAILDREPQPLSQSISQPPNEAAELERLLARLLAKGREDRYASASQLAADLKRLHHRLELDAERAASIHPDEVTLFLKPQLVTAEPGTAKARAAVPSVAETQLPSPVTPLPKNETATKKSADGAQASHRSLPLVVLAALLLVALIAAASWWALHQRAPAAVPSAATETLPERSFSYSLTVQKVRDGNDYQSEFQSSGRDFYENGWRFRLNFSSPQSGYLYLINEGPTKGGAIGYTLLFPMPSINNASAKVEANERMQTNGYEFDQHPGVEKFWVVWAAQPFSELEEIKAVVLNTKDKGSITNPQQRDTVRALLARSDGAKIESTEDKVKKQTRVRGRDNTLLHLIELEHH